MPADRRSSHFSARQEPYGSRSQLSAARRDNESQPVTYDGRPVKQEAVTQQPTPPVDTRFHLQHSWEEYQAPQPLPAGAICTTHGLPLMPTLSPEAAYNGQYIAPGYPAQAQTPEPVSYEDSLPSAITTSDILRQRTSHTVVTSSMAGTRLEAASWDEYGEEAGDVEQSGPIDDQSCHGLYEEVDPQIGDCLAEESDSVDGSMPNKADRNMPADEEEDGFSGLDDDELDAELEQEHDEGEEVILRASELVGRVATGLGAGVDSEEGETLWEYLMTGPDGEVHEQADDEEERNAFENELGGSGDWDF